MRTDLRFLLLVMDGLRPDLATPERMPNLQRLRDQGVNYANARAAFPTETRVNQATLVTGCWPARHGLVANQFIASELEPDGLLNTGDFAALCAADQRSGGGILTSPDLGTLLHNAGGSLAVLGSGTTGGNRILHRRAQEFGNLNMSLHGQAVTTTPEVADAVLTAMGPVPAAALPNTGRTRWLADAYMDYVAPQLDPTVTILWFSDPDSTYHYRGIGSAEALEAMTEVDRQLGRVLDWREASGRADQLNLIALSDHGHVSTIGAPLDLAQHLAAAGLDTDIAVVRGRCGGLYPGHHADAPAIVEWLQRQDWCGLLLSSGTALPGVLDPATVNLDHPRTAPITFVLADDLEAGSGGHPGRALHDNPGIPAGGSMHGGLTPYELNHVMAFSGPSFQAGLNLTVPAGLVDVAPTLLRLLDIPMPQPSDGRPLDESTHPARSAPPATPGRSLVDNRSGYAAILEWDEVAGRRYLSAARRL